MGCEVLTHLLVAREERRLQYKYYLQHSNGVEGREEGESGVREIIYVRGAGSGAMPEVLTYLILPDDMRHDFSLLGLQPSVCHGSEPHVRAVVVGSLEW